MHEYLIGFMKSLETEITIIMTFINLLSTINSVEREQVPFSVRADRKENHYNYLRRTELRSTIVWRREEEQTEN